MADQRESTEYNGTFNDFLSVVFRRKWIVITPVVAALVVVAYLVLTHVPQYFAFSKLLVRRGHQTSAFTQSIKPASAQSRIVFTWSGTWLAIVFGVALFIFNTSPKIF